jgi:hypothetical protein
MEIWTRNVGKLIGIGSFKNHVQLVCTAAHTKKNPGSVHFIATELLCGHMWIRTWSVCLSCFLWSWKNNMDRNFKRGLPTQILQICFQCFYIFRFSNLNSHLVFRRSILNDSRFLTLHVRFSIIGSQLLVFNARFWNVSIVTCLFSVLYFAFWVWNCPCSNFDFRPVDFSFRCSNFGCRMFGYQYPQRNSFLFFWKYAKVAWKQIWNKFATFNGLRWYSMWENPMEKSDRIAHNVLKQLCFFHRWWRWMPFLTVYLELVLNHARPLPLSLSFTFFRFKTTLSWRQCVAKRAQRLKMMMRGPTLQMTGSRSSHENAAGSKIKIDSWSPPPPPKKTTWEDGQWAWDHLPSEQFGVKSPVERTFARVLGDQH